jgi:hypothetical protein
MASFPKNGEYLLMFLDLCTWKFVLKHEGMASAFFSFSCKILSVNYAKRTRCVSKNEGGCCRSVFFDGIRNS